MDKTFFDQYGEFLGGKLKPKRSVRVVFDCSNGYAGEVLKKALKGRKDVQAYYLNDVPNGDFPGHGPNPILPEALNALGREVLLRKADLGVTLDGDADRVIFIDDKGREIDPDMVVKLYIERKKPEKVALDIRMGRLVTGRTIKTTRTRVGNYYVKKAMIEKDISFGAERSGHYFFKLGKAYIDMAIMMTFVFINFVSEKNEISSWIDDNQTTFRLKEKNYSVKNSRRLLLKIRKAYAKQEPKWSELDGLTAEFKRFWFNIRPSSTGEELIRINMEADTEEILKKESGMLESLIRNE